MNDGWIIATAVLASVNAGTLGIFLLLRKMTMVGDAISHAVLPGIAVAYLLSGEKTSVWMLVLAAFTGVLVTWLIDIMTHKGNMKSDASVGIAYTVLFAIGMIIISGAMGGNVDIDQECVLFGDIGLINMDKIIIDENLYLGPKAFYVELVASGVIYVSVIFGFKGFRLLAFNEEFGTSLGVNIRRWHFFLMLLISLMAVMSFEVIGAVLVVGFMVIPPATARLLTDNLIMTIAISNIFGAIGSVAGYFIAVSLDVSITGMMVLVSGTVFFAVLGLKIFGKRMATA